MQVLCVYLFVHAVGVYMSSESECSFDEDDDILLSIQQRRRQMLQTMSMRTVPQPSEQLDVQVSEQYEQFPYPRRLPEDEDEGLVI